jgi:DnaK suppressor protein
MTRRDALRRLHECLLARGAALGDALAGGVENLRSIRTDQTANRADGAFASGSAETSTQLVGREACELHQIHRALALLTQGTNGICEVCHKKIPVARLSALPYSTTCINCQREMEGHLGSGCAALRDAADWEKIDSAAAALEDQHKVGLTTMKSELSSNL